MNTNDINERTEDIQDQVEEAAGNLKQRAQQWQQTAKEKALKLSRTTDAYVHENPWNVIGMVAVFAFTIGFLCGNRRD